jgi:trehalose 6-phosphate phosphatase
MSMRPSSPTAVPAASDAPELEGDWALFLDIDGTLLDIAPNPAEVRVDRSLLALLGRLNDVSEGAIALISGRAAADIDALFAPLRLCVSGQHGAARRDAAGRLHQQVRQPLGLRRAAERLARFVAERPGLILENKGVNLAVHYRGAQQYEDEVSAELGGVLVELGEDFELQSGKMVLELKPAGLSKGTAIAQFMREDPFRGRTPVVVGDDLTDESAFAMVNKLRGCSIKVGPGESAATWRLAGPREVRAWLQRLLRP